MEAARAELRGRGESCGVQQGRCGTEAAIIRYQMVTIHYEEIGDDPSLPGILCTTALVLQKVPSEANPKVRNHGEGPY